MDYEKKYNEMVRRAKELYESGNALTRQQMEIVCPELTESEDERIRKFLLRLAKRCNENSIDFMGGIKKKDVIAYLEKQKEEPADAKSERVIKAARRVLNNWLDGTDCPDVSGDFAELEYAFREYDGEEKQKEQKPVEPSDDELQRHQDELYDFKVFAAKQAREHHISFVHDFEWNNFCAELLSYFNEKQKPTELDELEKLRELTHEIQTAYMKGIEVGRKEQKPAEWSEEDVDMLNSCISSIEEAKENRYAYKETDGDTSYDHEIDWLKSLRPQSHWKPSEEQMDALKFSLGNGGKYNKEALTNLYDNLKKLM